MELIQFNEAKNTIYLKPLTYLDLIILCYLLSNKLSTLITEVYWQDRIKSGERYLRGERRRIIVELEATDIRFSTDFTSIRVTGLVKESKYEYVKGRKIGVDIILKKSIIGLKSTSKVLNLLKNVIDDERSTEKTLYVLVVSMQEITVAKVTSNIEILYDVFIGGIKTQEVLDVFKKNLEKAIEIVEYNRVKEESYVVVGFDLSVEKYVRRYSRYFDLMVEGGYGGSIAGILEVLNTLSRRDLEISNQYLDVLKELNILMDGVYHNAIVYGIEDIRTLVDSKAVKTLYVCLELILEKPEVIDTIIRALQNKVKIVLTRRITPLGVAIAKYGCITAITYY